MNTPIADFLHEYKDRKCVRAHMPGNKGRQCIPAEYDITEIDGADFLFSPTGIIKESEENAALLFVTGKTLYSTEGSSLCIKTMIALLKKLGIDKVLVGRNAHVSFINACVLTGVEAEWVYPQGELTSICSGSPTTDEIDKALEKSGCKAVYITSPDYLGVIADVAAISKVCKKHGAMLLVDNAHGAYLKFTERDIHPITLGADMCCDSAHKTLSVLTGGAYLHISKNADERLLSLSKSIMSVFATTSPSYLIMASLDLANKALTGDGIKRAEARVKALKNALQNAGIEDIAQEPLKVTVKAQSVGKSGDELAHELSEKGVICEYYDRDAVVLMLSQMNTDEDIERIENALLSALNSNKTYRTVTGFQISEKQSAVPMREAFFSPDEEINTDDARGRICSRTKTVCPPCIPIIVPGEVFDENAIKILKRYGISKVNVVK